MPASNQINPFNYNIDNFDSGILGPISDTNFRTYLFTHNLPVANNVISGVLGGNPWQSRGTEYDVSQSNPSVVDVPNLQDVAQTPSLYNNLTNPRQVNLSNNLQNLNPEVQNLLGQSTPIQAGLGQDVTTQFNSNTSNIDLPSPEDVAQIPSNLNNFTEPRIDNLAKNPTPLDLVTWYPIEFAVVYNQWAGNYNTSYGVPQTLRLGFAGNVESWVQPGGNVVTANDTRQDILDLSYNKWGPSSFINYSYLVDEVVKPNTGLIQYNTVIQGDFRDQLLSRSLGVGVIPFSTIGSGINFKPDGTNISELDKIARKQRGVEVLNRIKLNFTDTTIGALNVSPFNLLAGGNLIQQNYTITVPKTAIGKTAQFAADLAGFNVPTSIIPTGEVGNLFGLYNVDGTSPDITGILDYTGSGQKSLLYNALYINKYGPTLNANPPTTSLGKITKEKLGAGQAPNTQNYLTYQSTTPQNTGNRNTSLIDKINQKVKEVVGKSNENAENLRSTVFEDTSPAAPAPSYGGFYGRFEQDSFVSRSNSDLAEFNGGSAGNEIPVYEDKEQNLTTYNGTAVEQGITLPSVTNERFDWRVTDQNSFKKGLLKYTQNIVNNATLTSPAGYIGYFDSEGKTGALVNGTHQTGASTITEKPKRPSKGNVVRNTNFNANGSVTGGDSYCRSWSSRRKYHTYENLIRKDGNWWGSPDNETPIGNNPNMTLNYESLNGGGKPTGLPKIAWNDLDNKKGLRQVADLVGGQTKIKGQLIPYMFSIENLAWKDAPQYLELPACEKGPNGGRIMWFPPYDINFDDNTTVNWDTTNFIGRGEPIYTYNHTERSGTLSWSIVVDHSNVLNQLRKTFKDRLNDETIHSYFAGCDNETLKNIFSGLVPEKSDVIKDEPNTEQVPTITPCQPSPPPYNNIKIYFENARVRCQGANNAPKDKEGGGCIDGATAIGRDIVTDLLNEGYEITVPDIVNINANEWQTNGALYPCGPASGNTYEYLNMGKINQLEELAKFLSTTEDGKNYKIKIVGYTSPANPQSGYNQELGLHRAINLKRYFHSLMVDEEKNASSPVYLEGNPEYGTYNTEEELVNNNARWYEPETKGAEGGKISNCTKPCPDGNPCDSLEPGQANSREAKLQRYAEITLEPNLELQTALLEQLKNKEQEKAKEERLQKIREREERQRQTTINFAANGFVTECEYFEHIKREDSFVYDSLTDKIKNFHPAFHAITPEGFNSRLTFLQQCTRQGPQVIDPDSPQNMVFGRPPICVLRIGDFYHTKIVVDNVNITYEPLVWDLNPEGIGVQPMIAKVSMGFKFIGGSSLGGPIKQLQNAVSYNFFANTSVYRPALKIIGEKYDFIYGAFTSPKDEDDKLNSLNTNNLKKAEEQVEKENQNSSNANQTQNAATTQEEKDKINGESQTSTTTATEGDSKVPTQSQPSGDNQVIFNLVNNDSSEFSFSNQANLYYVNILKPSGKYIVYKITDNRPDCCPGLDRKTPAISASFKDTLSFDEKIEIGNFKLEGYNAGVKNGQITYSFIITEENPGIWNGDLNMTLFYNPGQNRKTKFQQEVVFNEKINILN